LLCHGTVCVVGKMRDLILQLSKSSIYSTKPFNILNSRFFQNGMLSQGNNGFQVSRIIILHKK
ncbi:hypothetical protein M3B44_24950, partial [Klebsiella quasipneumoniae]|nr:hypothetical protein [Klebsiella quasipneumoniae]